MKAMFNSQPFFPGLSLRPGAGIVGSLGAHPAKVRRIAEIEQCHPRQKISEGPSPGTLHERPEVSMTSIRAVRTGAISAPPRGSTQTERTPSS
jgi:hypothetical protein